MADSSTDHDIFGIPIRFNLKPDGNFQFASLCEQLKYKLNIDTSHAHLRCAVVEHSRNDDTANLTKHFVSESWSSYLRKMDLLGTYGDHITLMTLAVLYEVQIIVLSTTKIATLVSCKGNAAFDPAICCLFVGHFPEGYGEHSTDPLTFCTTESDTQVHGDACDIRNAAEKHSEGNSEWPSAECERAFSLINIISTDLRCTILVKKLSSLMLVNLDGPPLRMWRPESYVKSWLRFHRLRRPSTKFPTID